jgi:transposase
MTEREENILLRAENAALRLENAAFRAESAIFRLENIQFRQEIISLSDKVTVLLTQLSTPLVKKDSHNSSLPPSSDFFVPLVKKTKSLRGTSTLKSGGQVGHPGTTLKMTDTPNTIIDLKNNYCVNCGESLSEATFVLQSKRQVIELPPIIPIYEEFRQYSCACPKCHQEQVADFPLGVNAPIQYGASVEGFVCYYSVYQYIPFARLQNLFMQTFSLPLSQGTIGNILERSAKKCEGVYQVIKTQIAESQVVGSDETGTKVNGAKWWIWVWQNILNTFIIASDNRGFQTVQSVWQDGLKNAILVTDRWAAQLKAHVKGNQLCLPHLQRNIIFLEESEKHPFATQFRQLLSDIFTIRKELVLKTKPYKTDDMDAKALEKKINSLLLITINKEKYPHSLTFQASMLKHRNNLTPCLYNLDIPPDNNGSERAIRNIKVKQKVSGQFKSGQNAFCVIRSVIDTLRKRGVEVLPCLIQIIKLQPV